MGGTEHILFLAACLVCCTAHPLVVPPTRLETLPEVQFIISEKPQPMTLECITSAKDVKSYSWQKNGQPLEVTAVITQNKDGSLLFLAPKAEDEGSYRCFAHSDDGISTSPAIKVKRMYIDAPKLSSVTHTDRIKGRPSYLDCSVPKGYPKPTISWVIQDSNSKTTPILNMRITQAPDGRLFFSNLTEEDAGKNFKYVCLANSPAEDKPVPLVEHIIADLIEDKDAKHGELMPQYLSMDMTVKAGDVTMIYCIYGGTPLAHPDWFFEGKNVNNNPGDRITRYNRTAGKRLLIKDTYVTDQGTYSCVADNEVGKPMNHSVYLTVVDEPIFKTKPEIQVLVKEGQDITIPCHAAGSTSAPKISWTYNGKPLKDTEGISFNTKGTGKYSSVADLTIKKVKITDKGFYGCEAVDEYGEIYAETLLKVQ